MSRHEDSNAPSLSEMEEDERELEAEYKRGFDAGVEHQKKAEPTPKAKQYRDERNALAKHINALVEHAMWDADGAITLEEFEGICVDAGEAVAALRRRP